MVPLLKAVDIGHGGGLVGRPFDFCVYRSDGAPVLFHPARDLSQRNEPPYNLVDRKPGH